MREKRVPWMCISGISVRNYLMEKTKNITSKRSEVKDTKHDEK